MRKKLRKTTPFGQEVKKKLIERNMTQAELADLLGCNKQYLYKILTGERSGQKYVERICSKLGIECLSEEEVIVIQDTEMVSVQTARSGIFESFVRVGDDVQEGTPLANIVHPYDGEILETLYAPVDSKVFFMQTDPLTYANTSVFKLVGKE